MTISSEGTTQNDERTFQNNLVAHSDYQQAMNGINEYFENEGKKFIENFNVDRFNDETSLTMHLLRKHLMKSCNTSLQRNFARMTQEVPDAQFNLLMEEYYPPLSYEERSGTDEPLQRLRAELQEVEEEEDEEEFEEEDLIDPKALKQAQDLREKVRTLSTRVEELRGSVVLRACKIAESGFKSNRQLLESDPLPNVSVPEDLISVPPFAKDISSTDLYKSMDDLAKLVNHAKFGEIPNRLNVLEETMEVIRNDTTPVKTLSQTESSIVSRINEKENVNDARQRDLLTPLSPADEETPQDRLADFLARVML